MVFLVDNVVAIEIFPSDTTEAGAILDSMVVDFLLTLENAVIDETNLCAKGMADDTLYAVAAKVSTGGDGLWQPRNLVTVGADVAGDVVLEVAHLAPVAYVQLDAFVFHLAGIDPLVGSFAHHHDGGHIDQNVLGLLEVPFKGAVEGVVEEAEVEAEVGLRGGFPFQVVVAQLVALET